METKNRGDIIQKSDQPPLAELQTQLHIRFSEFRKTTPASKSRRYPKELKELVAEARTRGLKSSVICRLTGISSSVVHDFSKQPLAKEPTARRLTVVGTKLNVEIARVVICLSSGVSIELSDTSLLSKEFLGNLNQLEAPYATSR